MGDFTINITECCGKNIVTREDGKKVHDILADKWRAVDRITMDFGNVLVASVSFLDEIFGKLATEYSALELTSKINLTNIQGFDRALVNDIIRSRLQQTEVERLQERESPVS